jgi:hypothetical protein
MRFGAAAVLAALALFFVSHTVSSRLVDALAMPGGLLGVAGGVAGLYDIPSGVWAGVCLTGNLAFYTGLFWIFLWFFWRRKG